MIVELTGGGPFDGDQANVLDSVRTIILTRMTPAAFLQPLGPVPGPGEPSDGYERVGAYVAQGEPPATFCWAPEEG